MLQDFLNELKINGRGKQSVYLYNHALTEANNYKPLNEWNKNDVSEFILFLQEKKAGLGREGEVLAVKLEDIEKTDKGIIMSLIQTKTGKDRRRVLLPFATQFIRNHITYRGLSKGDYLFPGRVKGEALSHTQSWRMLKQIAKKAGIDKPMSCP